MAKFRFFLTIFAFGLFCSQAHPSEEFDTGYPSSCSPQSRPKRGSFVEDDIVSAINRKTATANSSKRKKQVISQHSVLTQERTSLSTLTPLQKPEDKFLSLFCSIIKKGPYPIEPLKAITAQDEDREGSRKWVNSFDRGTVNSQTNPWHVSSSKILKEVRMINSNKQYLPVETNFSMARLIFVLNDGNQVTEDIQYFFVSGWPANNNKAPVQDFSQALSEGRLGKALEPYKNYGLRFITMSYQGKEPQNLRSRDYKDYRQELKDIFEKEHSHQNPLISRERLQSHVNLVSGDDGNILSKLYFHSEQSLWPCVKERIEKFKATQRTKSVGNLRSYLGQELSDTIKFVMLDTCSFYDMCWCCGDTLVSCSHTYNFGEKVIIRASGCEAYFDMPLSRESGPLRSHREEFSGYAESKAYEIDPNYKPYVAHAAVENLL